MFLDQRLEKTLLRDGYVKIPFLNIEEIQAFDVFYNQDPPKAQGTFHSTPLSTNIEYRRGVTNEINKIFKRPITSIFSDDYDYFFGSFTVKEPNAADSEWNLHQDWTFIDEQKHHSLGVWVPLCDVNQKNGCLSVVKRSHRFLSNVRGTNTFSEYSNISSFIKQDYLTPIPMKAGEAILFLNSMLHYSGPNLTDERRISVNCLMFPKKAQPYHFYHDNDWEWNEVEKFESSAETMVTHNFLEGGKPRSVKSCGRMKLNTSALTEKEFAELYKKYNRGVIERAIETARSVFR